MHSKYSILFISFIFLLSCEKRVWENPFDSVTQKSIFTPSNLIASQIGLSINLTWTETNNLISGYIIEKQVENGIFTKIATLPKGTVNYIDFSTIAGKIHTYKLTAYADKNLSNTISTVIKPATAPKINETTLNSKTYSTATFFTNVSDEGSPIITSGVCWSTSPSPTISNSKANNSNGANSFSSKIFNLIPNTTYYIRSFASNAIGISYGPQQTLVLYFNSPGPSTSDGSGNTYSTVRIGDQTWISKNLVTNRYQNGQSIPNITNGTQWTNSTSGAYCSFNNDINSSTSYGHLYNYFAVTESRNICPVGYHVPSKQEWETLISFIEGSSNGPLLKEAGTTYWSIANGNNLSGFNARSGSWRSQDAGFYYSLRTGGAYFWSSTKDNTKYPWIFFIGTDTPVAKTSQDPYFETAAGASVRCLKN